MRSRPTSSYYLQQLAPTPLVPVQIGNGPEIWCKLEFLSASEGAVSEAVVKGPYFTCAVRVG